MVLKEYDCMEEVYEEVKLAACGRQACSVMLLVATEVDAIASARILTKLFRSDNITYKIRPVANFSHIQETIAEFTQMDIKTVFMINCGAIYNLPKLFGLEHGGEIRCFIIDNHRPVHLANIHSNHNVVVLNDGSISEDFPSDGSDLSVNNSQSSSNEEIDDDEDDLEEGEENSQGELSDNDSVTNESGDDSNKFSENVSDGAGSQDEDTPDVGGKMFSEDISDVLIEDQKSIGDRNGHSGEDHENVLTTLVGDADDDEDDVRIVGKKRKALHNKYDPKKARQRKMRDYYGNGNCFSIPTAVMLITLVKNLNMVCTNDILWQAILGATDHYQKAHISETLYNAICTELKKQLPESEGRGTHSVGVLEDNNKDAVNEEKQQQVIAGSKVTIPGAETGHINWAEEYRFYMHRHWSLYDAMFYSNYVASKLEVWKTQGTAKLKEMLARVGIPLQQSQQSYNYMTPTLRIHFRRQILESEIANDYGLDNPGILYQSFYRYNSFKNPIAAADVVNAINALLEMGGDESLDLATGTTEGLSDDLLSTTSSQKKDSEDIECDNESSCALPPNWVQYFNKAYDCMGMHQASELTLKKGIAHALSLQKAIVGQGSTMLERSDAITRLKCFRYAFISRSAGGSNGSCHSTGSGATNDSIFGRPNVLTRLAHFLMDVQRSNGAWAGRKAKPLILAAEKRNTFLVIGVVPATSEELRDCVPPSKFRHYFKMAADQTKALHRNDGFDTSIIEVNRDDVNDFIEDLMFIMT